MRQQLDDGDLMDVGQASVWLSGSAGFTDAVAYHFYEKGYDCYTHDTDNEYEVQSADGCQTTCKISARIRLTCHGPETRRTVNQVPRISFTGEGGGDKRANPRQKSKVLRLLKASSPRAGR